MSSPPKPAAAKTPASSERKSKQAPSMSHDRIAADIAAFRKAGGKVEVLGNTPIQRRVTPATGAPAATTPAATPSRARR